MKLVPKLRFPEFLEAGEWEKTSLDKVASFSKGKGISKTDISQTGKLPCIRYGELYTYYKETIIDAISYTDLPSDSLVLSKANDVIIPASGETREDIATASCVLKDGIALGGDLNIIRTKINGVFLSYYLNNAKRKDISQLAQGISVVHLYPSQLKTLNIVIPKIPEQQKIAACLSSLDDLITAENQKLDALKRHKKGLMQQLFPAEGETVPKLRFPEFLEAGEWEEKKISDFAKITTGNKDTQNKIDNGEFPFFVRSQTIERINSYSFDGEAVLTAGDGVGVGKIYHYIKGKFDFHQRVYCVYDFQLDINGKYFYLYFSSRFYNRVIQLSAKNSVDSVRMFMIADMLIIMPKLKEQQKIAACLSSLDDLITAQSKKLDTLKKHKQGLMQQLFPQTEA